MRRTTSTILDRPWIVTALTAWAMIAGSGMARAGLIVVSGDSNIPAPLIGSTLPQNAGNQRFFTNLLNFNSGSRVLVAGNETGPIVSPAEDANTFYQKQAGVSSALTTFPITAANLTGVDLFLSIGRAMAYSVSEIAALKAFSNAGGSILITGDGAGLESNNNTANLLLSGLGSGLSIATASLDSGIQTAPPGRIAPTPLTTGVGSFGYAYTSMVAGGTSLITTTNGSTFLAFENVSAVPEPASIAMVGLGLAGLGWVVRGRVRN